jgi:2-oxoisovalerate dehydrogenase E1 component alpha subunit
VALYYRDIGLLIGIGVPPVDVLLSMFARAADKSGGRQFPNHYTNKALGVISISSIIAAHLPHAVGIAYSFKYRKENGRAVVATFGEGSTSEGEWHESMNFASVHKLPVVFLCENNGYAISVPQEHQMAIEDVAVRAAGYGMPSEIVDGMDPLATYAAIKRALDRAHSGGGPTLVEAKCYRFLSHSTDDDDRTYRDREIVNERRKDDPLPRYEKFLTEHGVLTAAAIAKLKRAVLEETNAATDLAESMPLPVPSDLYTNLHEGAWEPWQ